MSIKLMNLAWEMELPMGQKMVLMALADRANTDGICWPAQASLAKMCSMSERALRDNLTRLQQSGLIEVTHRRTEGSFSSSAYRLNIGNCSAPPAESADGTTGRLRHSPSADCDTHHRQIATSPSADCDTSPNYEPTLKATHIKPSVASKPRPPEKITFDETENKFSIPLSRYADWENVFPKINLDSEIDKAELWLAANPKRRKKNYDRFLLGWFSRAAENAKPRVFIKQPFQHQARPG